MKTLNIFTAIALVATLAILPGCGESKPGDDIPRAETHAATPEAPAEPAEAPAEEPMEEAAPAEAPAEPAEAPAEPAEAPAPAGEAATYIIEPNDVNNLGFTGYKVTGNKQGGWTEYSGTVELTDGTIESAKINMTINMPSLFTVATLLTETLQKDVWFNIAEFPEATFVSTMVEKAEDGYKVTGDLTIRGTTTNISFPAQISVEGDQLMAQAKFAVNRSSWGMTDTGLADDLIKDEVVIQFDVVADKAS